ncbi:YchJ family protein [Amycolatopsis sp. cg5]|uniref:YchJ family protein n=1 Tax=Amycolatopsis sp. cg5 TaxID=3238802 RepID=UPI003525AEC0
MTGGGCPCGYGLPYDECCGRLHDGRATASTAEQLMRSRFSAFAVGDTAYLRKTWLKPPSPLDLDADQRWTRLEILGTTGGGPFHAEGTVEFRAHYVAGGVKDSMHENSAFTRVGGQWVYVRPVA